MTLQLHHYTRTSAGRTVDTFDFELIDKTATYWSDPFSFPKSKYIKNAKIFNNVVNNKFCSFMYETFFRKEQLGYTVIFNIEDETHIYVLDQLNHRDVFHTIPKRLTRKTKIRHWFKRLCC